MPTDSAYLTIRETADTLGVSPRTIRRRIKDGELSATKRPHGRQDVWFVDGAELARYAQATGQVLTLTRGKPGQTLTGTLDNEGQRGAQSPQAPSVDQGQDGGNGSANAATLDNLRQEADGQRLTIAALTDERDFLRERLTDALRQVGNLTEAVTRLALPAHEEPPATEPTKRTFWQWFTGRGEGGGEVGTNDDRR